MAEAMRWFGPTDSVTLAAIRQTGATDVFTSLHEIPYGEAWPAELIVSRRDEIAAAGLTWRVVESVPVSEAIKTRTGDFERHLENYRVTLERLGAAGIHVVEPPHPTTCQCDGTGWISDPDNPDGVAIRCPGLTLTLINGEAS
jgi:mannonate dehydratase